MVADQTEYSRREFYIEELLTYTVETGTSNRFFLKNGKDNYMKDKEAKCADQSFTTSINYVGIPLHESEINDNHILRVIIK